MRPAFTAREIGRLPDIPDNARATFVGIACVVERVFSGGEALDAHGFAACRKAYEGFAFPGAWAWSEPAAAASRPVFRARTAIALVLVGVFAFSAFVTLAAFAPDLQRDLRCRANVYSTCAVGFGGAGCPGEARRRAAGDQPPGHARRPQRGAVHRHP